MAVFPTPRCTIQGVTISGNDASSAAAFRRTDITTCTLKGIQLHNCTISDCQVDSCELFNCTVKNSTIIKSSLHMTSQITNCSLSDCTVTKSPLAFHKFPGEIRAMIFQYCVAWLSQEEKRERKTPKLLVALRCDAQLYPEAIKLFYGQNYFLVKKANFQDCNSMSKHALESILNLKIICNNFRVRLEARNLPEALEHCTAVETLALYPLNSRELQQWIQVCLAKFTTIRMLHILIPSWHLIPGNTSRAVDLINILPELGQRLGAPGRQWSIRTDRLENWFWEAPKRGTLKWTEG